MEGEKIDLFFCVMESHISDFLLLKENKTSFIREQFGILMFLLIFLYS